MKTSPNLRVLLNLVSIHLADRYLQDVTERVELTAAVLGHGRYGTVYCGWYQRSSGVRIAVSG